MTLKKLHSYSLFVYVFLLSFEYWEFLGGLNHDFSISKLSAIIYAFIYILRFKRPLLPVQIIPYLKLLFTFYFLLLLSSLFYFDEYSSVSNVFNFNVLLNFMLFWFITTHMINNPEIIHLSLKWFVLGGITISVLIALKIGIVIIEERVFMFGEDPNYVGYRLVFTTVIMLTFLIGSKKMNKLNMLFWILFLPLLLGTIVETGSRGAIICFFFLLLIIALRTKTKWYLKALMSIGLLAIAYLMFLYLINNEMLMARIFLTINQGDTANRVTVWSELIGLFELNPITGIGETGFIKDSIRIFGRYKGAHNVYLEVLIKTGIIGFLIYFGFMLKLFRDSSSILKKTKNILPFLLMIGILFMFSNIQGVYNKSVYFCFAYISASVIILQKKKY